MKKNKNKKTQHVALVVDESGSMSALRLQAIKMIQDQIKSIKESAKANNIDTDITLVTFSSRVKIVKTAKAEDFYFSENEYRPSGQTALFEGLEKTINELKSADDGKKSFLVLLFTDGEENYSYSFNNNTQKKLKIESIRNEIFNLENNSNWTFAFQVTNKDYFCQTYGFTNDNVHEWKTIELATQVNTQATESYFTSRSTGETKTKAFYKCVVDLADLKPQELKEELKEVSSQFFKPYTIPSELEIKEFVESKKKVYVPGNCFYQLMKKEKINPDKEIVIQDKQSNKLYSGQKARELIGLLDNAVGKVEPGNHANYEIFVQSKSNNRKLPRGTKLLIKK